MKCGYVAVLGRPNAGKSSLVNFLVGEEVAIVSHRKQTTRNSILGIKNGAGYQIIFVDTPGIHHSKNKLDKFMMKNVRSALAGADVVLYLFDGTKELDEEELQYIEMLKSKTENLILLQTKADKTQLDHKIDAMQVSAENGKNVDILLNEIVKLLPENNAVYDEDYYTDKSISFLVAEKIRGILLNNLDKEIPHGVAVVINSFNETYDKVFIEADIVCEREQHKGIIIGKAGSFLKKVGQETRVYVEDLLEKQCILKLFVKVEKDWRDKNTQDFGY
ncbi:MAG: GTPase Era [Clostridiales bacterium]|nr:GTPase Era [Clostridiales bacterium]